MHAYCQLSPGSGYNCSLLSYNDYYRILNVNWCRGFFRIQCYSTCQAANFAATTSCTFGGLFWSTTLTCAQIFPVLSANAAGWFLNVDTWNRNMEQTNSRLCFVLLLYFILNFEKMNKQIKLNVIIIYFWLHLVKEYIQCYYPKSVWHDTDWHCNGRWCICECQEEVTQAEKLQRSIYHDHINKISLQISTDLYRSLQISTHLARYQLPC